MGTANNVTLVRDNSTFVNFSQWASQISAQFILAGWIQTKDTGQVMWSGFNITACNSTGGTSTYTINTITGLALAVGRAVTITSMTNAGNNGTFVITGGNLTTTITVANPSPGANESGSTGVVTKATTVPAVNNYVFEIWQPNDGLTAFYVKMDYGTNSASTNTGPSMRVTAGTTTSGAGVITGYMTNLAQVINSGAVAVTSTSTQWNSYFSGDTGRFGFMLWRDDSTSGAPILFVVQRSLNSSGTPTSTYFTVACVGKNSITDGDSCFQQSIHFTLGAGNPITPGNAGAQFVCLKNAFAASDAFAGQIPISPLFPDVGYFDNPHDVMGVASFSDFTEGNVITVPSGNMPYGVAHNYVVSSKVPFAAVCGSANKTCCMIRYD